MNRQIKILAGLGVALLGLGGLATWDEWKTKQDERDKETKGVILPLKPDQITGIHLVSRPDSDTGDKSASAAVAEVTTDVTLKRENNLWMIKSPVATRADQQVISDLLKSVTEYKSEADISTKRDQWATFGLETPRRRLDFELSDGKTIGFLVGINAPVGFSAYAATTQSDTIYSGSQYIATSLGKTLFDLRDKKFLDVSPATVQEVVINYPKSQITLRRAEGKWSITEPVSANADASTVNNALDDLCGLKAVEFFDHPDQKILALIKKATTHSTWKLKLTEGKEVTVDLLEAGEDFYARFPGQEAYFKLGSDNKVKLRKSLDDLRDKRIFSFESGSIDAVEVDGQKFKKKGHDWVQAGDETKVAPHIRGLIVDLEYAKAQSIHDGGSKVAKELPNAPLHTLTLTAGQATIKVSSWDAADRRDMAYLRVDGNPNVFLIKKTILANVAPEQVKPVGDELMPPAGK